MGVQLLDKTRKINKLLHNNSSSKVVFNDICQVLTDVLDSDILVISKKGKVLGSSVCKSVDELHELIIDEVGGYIDADLNERLLGILSTKENVNLETAEYLYRILAFAQHTENGEKLVIYQALYPPYKTCARPYDMFCSELDRKKYPDAKQKYRFEVVPVDFWPR